MATTPYSSDLSDSDRDDAGPSTRRHLQVSSSKADPEVLAPIVDPLLASRRVNYYHSPLIGSFSYGYGHPMKPQRMRMAHSLISAYGLDQCMTLREPKEADKVDMTRFHTDEYIDFLERVNPDNGMALTGAGTRFLVGEDCPPFQSVFQFCSLSSGGSISAANAINSGAADIAINWAGGLHHAKKREASGFCYTNDIVLGILELLRVHSRVLYIDIDIHHGDGVEEAFYSTNRVLTLSIHKFGDFFPGTGDVKDVGIGPGKGYAVNVPLRDGVGDREYQTLLFQPVVQHIMEWYRPGAVVLQCGADSLAGDKLGCFNLSMRGHAACVSYLQSFNVPLLMVGGGGYTVRNVARTWTYETALLLGREPDEDLPFNEYMNWFGPEYKLDVRPTSMENLNSDAYLEGLRSRIIDTLRGLPFAPSVQMQPTPKYAFNAHAEGQLSDSEEEGELEKRISKRVTRARIQQQLDSPLSDAESSLDEEEEEQGQENGSHYSSAARQETKRRDRSDRTLKRLLWSGNQSLDHGQGRQRSIFEREGSVMSTASSAAGPGKSWLGMGYSPSGLANGGGGGMGGPPEALKRILANANRQGSLSLGRNGGPSARNSRLRGLDSDMDVDSELDEEDGDDDVRMDESSDDGGATSDEEGASGYQNGTSHKRRGARGPAGLESVASSFGPSRRRTNGESSLNGGGGGGGGGNLTRAGRPKRSFFDSARPILNGHHANGESTRGSRNASFQPPLSTQAEVAGPSFVQNQVQQHGIDGSSTSHPATSAPTTTMEQDATAALQGSESLDQRQRELERGRRGEGGGSEVTSLVVSETDVPPGGGAAAPGGGGAGGAGEGAGGATAVQQGNAGVGVSGTTTATTTTTTAPGFSWMGEGTS